MLTFVQTVERWVHRIGLWTAIILIPLLIGVRIVEMVTRKLNTPSSLFNAMEAELFLLFAFLTIGAAYVSNAHVKVDILHERFSPQAKAWVDVLGALFFVLPFALIILWFGYDMVRLAFEAGERSALGLGRPLRWIIVAATPAGIGLFLLAVLCRMARQVLFLTGRGPIA